MTDRLDDAVCASCGRSAKGFGYAPKPAHGQPPKPILWTCGTEECLRIACETYHMPKEEFDRIESLAAHEGGYELEKFCEEIGKSDFRDFTQEEFFEGNRRMIAAYREALKNKLRDEVPF